MQARLVPCAYGNVAIEQMNTLNKYRAKSLRWSKIMTGLTDDINS